MFLQQQILKPKSANDRFIPIRKYLNIDYANYQTQSPEIEEEIVFGKDSSFFLNAARVRYTRENYRNALRTALLPKNQKILNFHTPNIEKSTPSENTWPVKPRKKPLIEAPNLILDLPNFNSNICHHVVDLNTKGCFATIYNDEVYMWYLNTEFEHISTNTNGRIKCCVKWNMNGTKLAVSLSAYKFGIWDIQSKKITKEAHCCILPCNVLCAEWTSPIRTEYIITGCNRGKLTIWTNNLEIIQCVEKAHTSAIINLAVSCSKNYLVTSGLDKMIKIWKLPQLEGWFEIKFKAPIRAIAWHPWKEYILAIGISHQASFVVLYNMQKNVEIARESHRYIPCTIDCVTFNPITAELVVSYFICDDNSGSRGTNIISVLSSMDCVKEELHVHVGRVLYLLWANNGKILASASADENLCIWEFFGPESKRKKEVKKIAGSATLSLELCIR